MKKAIALAILFIFSASIPSQAKAELSLLQLGTGLIQLVTGTGAAYYSTRLLYGLYMHNVITWKQLTNKNSEIPFLLSVRQLLGLAAGGCAAAATCFIAGHDNLFLGDSPLNPWG